MPVRIRLLARYSLITQGHMILELQEVIVNQPV